MAMTTQVLKSKMTNKSPLLDQTKLKIICDRLCDRIEDLLDYLNLEYRMNPKFVTMECPIHGGDNKSALNLYYVGDSYRGNWKCRTHQCEKVFTGSILGFIRGVLSHKKHGWLDNKDDTVSFMETVKFVQEFLHLDLNDLKANNKEIEKSRFVNSLSVLQSKNVSSTGGVSRDKVNKLLDIPSEYFVKRGFDPDILRKYDVGDCLSQGKEMSGRAVVPIYDHDHRFMIGCSGRSLSDELKPKWRHSAGFKSEENLYNFWYAKEHIQKTRSVILVESPGNVWKLEMAGIHNSVALFGANLADRQKMILDMSGAMQLIVIMDSDEAGDTARSLIDKKCSKIYNIQHIKISKNDIAELTIDEINQEIKSRINL